MDTILTDSLRDKLRRKAESDFYFFARGILGFDWLVPHIHKDLCRLLQDQENTRALIMLPRGWLKTTISSRRTSAGLSYWNRNHTSPDLRTWKLNLIAIVAYHGSPPGRSDHLALRLYAVGAGDDVTQTSWTVVTTAAVVGKNSRACQLPGRVSRR